MRLTRFKVGTYSSGHFGHEGRPGEVGGSVPSGQFGGEDYERRRAQQREALRRYRARKYGKQPEAEAPKPVQQRYNVFEMFAKMPAVITDDMVDLTNIPNVMGNIQERFPGMNEEILKRFFYLEGYKAYVRIDGQGRINVNYQEKGGYNSGTQTISGDYNEVHFDFLSLDSQGQDLGMPLVVKQIAMMKMLGVKEASMYADITIGKYAWAKEGVSYKFDWQQRDTPDKFYSWVDNNSWSKFTPAVKRQIMADQSWRSFTKPSQWAKYQIPGVTISHTKIDNASKRPGDYNIGKAFMLDKDGHGSWEAIVDLQELSL